MVYLKKMRQPKGQGVNAKKLIFNSWWR